MFLRILKIIYQLKFNSNTLVIVLFDTFEHILFPATYSCACSAQFRLIMFRLIHVFVCRLYTCLLARAFSFVWAGFTTCLLIDLRTFKPRFAWLPECFRLIRFALCHLYTGLQARAFWIVSAISVLLIDFRISLIVRSLKSFWYEFSSFMKFADFAFYLTWRLSWFLIVKNKLGQKLAGCVHAVLCRVFWSFILHSINFLRHFLRSHY